MLKTFSPCDNNLGGKKIIDTHKKKHILSVLNASPLINSLKIPHPHVNGTQRIKKKDMELNDYYKEVNETYKRVNSLRHGYVNHSEPKTFHLRNSISKRVVFEKNIILHDHMRNITHLGNSLRMISKHSEKRIETIKTMGTNPNNLSSASKKSLGKTKSIDFIFAADLLKDYNPFVRNVSCYDSADGSLVNHEKVIGAPEEKSQNLNKIINSKKETSLEKEFEGLNLEPIEGRYELLKKKVIEYLVKKKIYEREEAEILKEQLKEKFRFLDKEMLDEVFDDIVQFLFK